MASMTQAVRSQHDTRAETLFAIFMNDQLPDATRRAAEDEFFFLFKDLAYHYARKVLPDQRQSEEDIKQTAALALCEARYKWEPERGPFAIVLRFYVQNHVRNWLREHETIVRSHKCFQTCYHDKKVGKDGTDTDRINVCSLESLKDFDNNHDMPALDIRDPTAEFADRITLNVALREVTQALPDSERRVVSMIYGLNGDAPKTLRETARVLPGNRSHETVRLMLHRACKTMRTELYGCA